MRLKDTSHITLIMLHNMGPDATKPVFGVSGEVRLEPVSSATETSQKTENLLVARLYIYMILSNKRITEALTSLRGCAGWSAPLLFANHEDKFSQAVAHIICYTVLLPIFIRLLLYFPVNKFSRLNQY